MNLELVMFTFFALLVTAVAYVLITNLFSQGRTESAQLHTQLRTEVTQTINDLKNSTEESATKVRDTLNTAFTELRLDTAGNLEKMRETVDEKLQGTLEKRLGDSFNSVTKKLEEVHQGLGEMKALASDVGGLKRVLTNVKTRGILGEIQLGNLIEDVMAPSQFDTNVAVVRGSQARVEYAIRLPGDEPHSQVWLPIDSKFPREDYERLIDAVEVADADNVVGHRKSLHKTLVKFAKDISEKYISPPETTDFAILFLPTEGLYAEIAREPGLMEKLSNEHRIMIAGPSNLLALLNSLQVGFRTLAVQQHGSEVWKILGETKTEFQKFGDVIAKAKKKIDQAGTCLDDVSVRVRSIDRTFRKVELQDESAGHLIQQKEDA